MMLKLPPGDLLALDTESTGLLHRKGDAPFAVSICNEDMQTVYVEWPVDPFTREVQPNPKDVAVIQRAFNTRRLVMFNAAFDLRMLRNVGVDIHYDIEDASISIHVCRSCEDSYKLKWLCKKYGIMGDDDEHALQQKVVSCRRKAVKQGWKIHDAVQADYWLPRALDPTDQTCEIYAVKDAERTMKLWLLSEEIMRETGRRDSYEFEMRELFPVIMEMEDRGLRVCPKTINMEIKNCLRDMKRTQEFLAEISGVPDFNPKSDPQIKRLLFGKLGLKPKVFSEKTSQPSASADALLDHEDHPAVQALVRYRSAKQGVSTFFGPYHECRVPCKIQPRTWVIHPNIRQGGKRSARLSCTMPNLQGTTDSEGGRSGSDVPARKPFGPRNGFVWYLMDYSQLEVVTFAAASKYQELIDVLIHGRDMHAETAQSVYGGQTARSIKAAMVALGISDRTAAEKWLASFDYRIVAAEKSVGKKTSRAKGKALYLARSFGGGRQTFAHQIKCTLEEADDLIEAFDSHLPGVIKYIRGQTQLAKRQGYVTTVYGRQLDLPKDEAHKGSPMVVQGTAADVIKRAMIECDAYYRSTELPGGLIMSIHDELLFETPLDTPSAIVHRLRKIMESQGDVMGVPISVKVKMVNKYWSEPKEWVG